MINWTTGVNAMRSIAAGRILGLLLAVSAIGP